MTMTDIEDQLKLALGVPPRDLQARERALIRLRTQMAEGTAVQKGVWTERSTLVRFGAAMVVLLILIAGALGATSLRRPAAAAELEHLSQVNLQWVGTQEVPPVQIKQMYLLSGTDVSGALSYTAIVRSTVSRTVHRGAVEQTETILSADLLTAQDREDWKLLGSAPLPEPGTSETRRYDDAIYDLAAISTDPEELRQALEDGSVIGYLPDEGQLFESIGMLLAEPELRPEQRVALYQVAGSLDGVELLGEIPDPLGRGGVGFAYPVGESRQILIFDRDTGQPLAFEEFSAADPAQLDQWQAFDPPS
jgi:hypothetical protein